MHRVLVIGYNSYIVKVFFQCLNITISLRGKYGAIVIFGVSYYPVITYSCSARFF